MENSIQDSQLESRPVDSVLAPAALEEATLWQARAAYLQAQAQRSDEARAALQEKVLALDAQLCALEAHAAAVQTRLAQTEARLDVVQTAAPAPSRLAQTPARPHIVDLVNDLPLSLDRGNQYARRPLAQIQRLVLHHSGSNEAGQTPQHMAEFHINDLKHQWPGIGFHFFIGLDGSIYQTNRLETACFNVVNSNATTVGIVLVGDFASNSPNAMQMASTASLLGWLLNELRLPVESIAGHSEFSDQQTDCPGSSWLASGGWKELLLAQVRAQFQSLRHAIYHYVLLWQSGDAWAETDWQAAARYIARFRPTVGFSAEEASQAENVTIIGGPGGVARQVEDMLRAAGCRVQRIAGKNAKETRSLLDTLARDGQRFLER